MLEWIVVSLIVLAASAYLGRRTWRRMRRWTASHNGSQPAKPSRPQSITFKGKPLR